METETLEPKRRKSFIINLFQQASIVVHENRKRQRSTSCKNLRFVSLNNRK